MRELTSCFGVICLQRRHLLIGMSEGHQQPQPDALGLLVSSGDIY